MDVVVERETMSEKGTKSGNVGIGMILPVAVVVAMIPSMQNGVGNNKNDDMIRTLPPPATAAVVAMSRNTGEKNDVVADDLKKNEKVKNATNTVPPKMKNH